jgi:hypothetical protein
VSTPPPFDLLFSDWSLLFGSSIAGFKQNDPSTIRGGRCRLIIEKELREWLEGKTVGKAEAPEGGLQLANVFVVTVPAGSNARRRSAVAN